MNPFPCLTQHMLPFRPPPLQPARLDPGTVKVWLLPSGTILAVDQQFTDYAGWGPMELVGKPFSSLGLNPEEIDR